MDRLPNELLSHIFQCIDSTKTLARCRQVSKLWNTIATNPMFDLTVDISDLSQAWKFYKYLMLGSSKEELVKSINFGNISISTVELKTHILKLVFTQNMKSIQGHHCRNDFYSTMINIAKHQLNGKCSLQVLPHPAINAITEYAEAAAMFKETLQDAYVDSNLLQGTNGMQNALNYLAQFRSLISIAVELRNADMLRTVVNITVEMPKIKELTMYTSTFSDVLITGLQNMNQQSITRTIDTLKLFTDMEACTKLVLQHFAHLKSIQVHHEKKINPDTLDETINALKISPHFAFKFSINDRCFRLDSLENQLPDDVHIDSVSRYIAKIVHSREERVEVCKCYSITVKR